MTRLEAFKQRMQQYKLARALNPLLKYWDFKALSYAKGGITDDGDFDDTYVLDTTATRDVPSGQFSIKPQRTLERPTFWDYLFALPAYWKAFTNRDNLYNLLTNMGGNGNFEDYIHDIALDPTIVDDIKVDEANEYTGSMYDDTNNRSLVRLLVYGNGNLEPYQMKDQNDIITVNNRKYPDKQFIGHIFPQEEIYFPKEAELAVKDFAKDHNVLQMRRNTDYYNYMRMPLDNVTEHGVAFNYDDPDNPFLKFFDYWNFGDESFGKWGVRFPRINREIGKYLEYAVKPNELYPDSGPFVLRQNVPIKYIDYDLWKDMVLSKDQLYKLGGMDSFMGTSKSIKRLSDDLYDVLNKGWGDYERRFFEETGQYPQSFYFRDGGVTGEPEQNSFIYQGLIPIRPADNNPTNQLSDSDWSATDMVRLGSIAADIGAMFTPPGVSTGLSLASDVANLGADIADDRGFWNTAGTFAANLGLTTLGALPIVSQYAHASRAVKGLTKVAPKISAAVAGLGAAGLVSNADEILKSFSRIGSGSSLNKDDWRNIAVGVQLALGGGKVIKNANSSKRALNPLSVSTQNAAVLSSLPYDALSIIDEQSGNILKYHIPELQLKAVDGSLLPITTRGYDKLRAGLRNLVNMDPLSFKDLLALLKDEVALNPYSPESQFIRNEVLIGRSNRSWLRSLPEVEDFYNLMKNSLGYLKSPFVYNRANLLGEVNGLNNLIQNIENKSITASVYNDVGKWYSEDAVLRTNNIYSSPLFFTLHEMGGIPDISFAPISYKKHPENLRLAMAVHELNHYLNNSIGRPNSVGSKLQKEFKGIIKSIATDDSLPSEHKLYLLAPQEWQAHLSLLLALRYAESPFTEFPFKDFSEMSGYARQNFHSPYLNVLFRAVPLKDLKKFFDMVKKYAYEIMAGGVAASQLSKDNDRPESYAYGTDEVGDENGRKQNKVLNVVKNVLGFTPYLGDAISLYDAYKDVLNKDYLQAAIGAGLTLLPIPAAATKPIKKVAKKAAKEVARYIPTVNRKSVIELLNKLTGHDYAKMAKEGDINNMRNRSIERLYEPDVRARAELIKRLYDVDLLKTYDDILDLYTNEYHTLPQANLDPDLERNVAAQMTLTDLAREAFENNNSYIPKRGDYVLNVDNRSALPPQDIIDHEMTHYNLYMHLNSPNWEDSDLSRITNQFEGKLNDVNPLDPANTSYFRNWMEQNAYGISVYNALKEQGIKPTKGAVKKYINSLPDTDPVKKAAFLFKTIDDYYNWLMAMPLADTNKETENTYLA